jgi:hypothetical protein
VHAQVSLLIMGHLQANPITSRTIYLACSSIFFGNVRLCVTGSGDGSSDRYACSICVSKAQRDSPFGSSENQNYSYGISSRNFLLQFQARRRGGRTCEDKKNIKLCTLGGTRNTCRHASVVDRGLTQHIHTPLSRTGAWTDSTV